MASFGDQYSYQVVFDATGVADVRSATASVDQLDQSTKRFSRTAKEATETQYRMGRGSNNLGQAMIQTTFIMDDMRFGARALANNMAPLATTLLGFGVAGAAVGAAGTLLVGVFNKQIDAALAYAGILDENLVKGMDRAKERTGAFRESVEALNAEFERSPKAVREAAEAIGTIFSDVGADAVDEYTKIWTSINNPQVDQAYNAAIAKAKQQRDDLMAQMSPDTSIENFMEGRAFDFNRIAELEAEANAKREEAYQESAKRIARLQEQAVRGNQDAINKLYETAIKAFETTGDQVYSDMAQEVFELSDAFKKAEADARVLNIQLEKAAEAERKLAEDQKKRWEEAEKARQEENDAIIKQMQLEEEAENQRKRRVMERQAEEARGRLDATTRRVMDAFGPALQGQIGGNLQANLNRGASVEMAGMDVVAKLAAYLQRMGVEGGAANQAAFAMVEQQLPMLQKFVDTNNAQAMMTRDMLRNSQAMLMMFNQWRSMQIENARLTQQQRDWIARSSRMNRSNMLGTFRPF